MRGCDDERRPWRHLESLGQVRCTKCDGNWYPLFRLNKTMEIGRKNRAGLGGIRTVVFRRDRSESMGLWLGLMD